MADSRSQAADLGAHLEISSCLENCQKRSPDVRRQPFSGKSFYLDLPAGKNLQFLTTAIQQLGGVIEGFLSKEISYIVSNRKEAKAENHRTSHGGSPSEIRVETPSSTVDPKELPPRPACKPVGSVPMTRGKELLQKAIRNQGSSSGGGSKSCSSLLANARSWGVRILHVDEMMMHIQQLSLAALCVKKQRPKKSEGTCPATESRTRKVARLKAPFLKIEDESRKFRPFLHQFKSFPEISFLGSKEASPFESLTAPGSLHHTREPKDRGPSPRSAACTTAKRKKGYCECCQEAFEELHRHLQSSQHQAFALEAQPYAEVDQIIAQLSHPFADITSLDTLPRQPDSLSLDIDPLCLEISSPRMKKEDEHRAPGAPEQNGTVGNKKASDGTTPGPGAGCQKLEGVLDDFAAPPGTPVSRNPARQGLMPSSGSADPSSAPDLVPDGHKRKIRFPNGNAKKKLGTSFFVPCGTRTDGGRHLSFFLPCHEPRSLDSLLASSHPQNCLCIPDPSPWQLTDKPADIWTTQLPQPGRDWPPGSEASECVTPASGRLTSIPAAPQLQASSQPTCNQLLACSPQEDIQGISHPLSPTVYQPVGEPVALDGSGFPSPSLSPGSWSPTAVPAEHSCGSPEACISTQDQMASDSKASSTGLGSTSAEYCIAGRHPHPTPPQKSQREPLLASEIQGNKRLSWPSSEVDRASLPT
ncbi:protein DBF4 homolog B isoform X2 [Erinaceus europaeus]|nr:protein DBF4 homolog B isoform X2 [Erinaceus europaeus]